MADRKLYIVKATFEFPALLTEAEVDNQFTLNRLARDALSDLSDVPFEVESAAPEYDAPAGYDDDTGVYVRRRDEFVTWGEAVAEDKERRPQQTSKVVTDEG